jgi:adenine-specific DNA-methyltransferase
MPTLDWIGKRAVINHHRDVPYRLIHCDKSKSAGDPDAGNLLVQGDNLEALKALLPYYAGKVKCIYIDPPYNTGNEGWIYNDNVNSPEIRAWLGKVVGKEAEDLSRHDKWLCMMYPRLRLLKDFLTEDGLIWISCDDNEAHNLKLACDEIFLRKNFLANVIWQKKYSPQNDAEFFSNMHDHILVYAKNSKDLSLNLISRTDKQDGAYKNFDQDPRGLWKASYLTRAEHRDRDYYGIETPSGKIVFPAKGRSWSRPPKEIERLREDGRLWFGRNGDAIPSLKRFLSEVKDGVVPKTIWLRDEVGDNQEGKKEIKYLFEAEIFDTPKPEKLIQRVIEISSGNGDIVMDSFAGSGTTGAVAQKLGRKFVMIEIGDHAHTHIAPRLAKVSDGSDKGGISESVGWSGGSGFRYCTLGEPLFDAYGNVSPSVTYPDLAAHVFFCETGSPIPRRADGSTPLIGTFQGRAIYLLHSADSVGVPNAAAGNVLTAAVLETLPLPEEGFTGARIVYAEGCSLPDDRLNALGVTFKQVPYQIEGL